MNCGARQAIGEPVQSRPKRPCDPQAPLSTQSARSGRLERLLPAVRLYRRGKFAFETALVKDCRSTHHSYAMNPPSHSETAALRFSTFADHNVAVGVAVRLLMSETVFARLPFASLAALLDGQAARGHYGFVVDGSGGVRGFLGWALATRERAETWADGQPLSSEHCLDGDCLIINVWFEKDRGIHPFMVERLRSLLVGKSSAYFRRMYRDGRMRTIRMPVDALVSGRAAETHPRSELNNCG